MSRPKEMAGFTLIELMVVIVLVAVFASIALPSFTSTIRNNNVQSSADELYRLLQYTRTEAVVRQANVVLSAPAADTWNGDLTVKVGNTTLRQLGDSGLGSNVAASSSTANVIFNSSGSTGSAYCITLCSTQDDSVCRYIGVQVTGRVLPPSTSKPGECS
ncbi:MULTISPECIES: GspH/FimT family pseudopilin [unclassified Pseudomonas]|uniref:GspH/FimT family pseudopilin n=1 Tax=unclassified Pseudomonas TaxID=196821 RepID=UPI0002A43003|nr:MULTISPECIES: GspH/FimT family pseudopilin [unclassified Pseudomonas]MBB1605930.1 type II secretion system protein GspH [Pseudomonas sp. UMC76]MBB1639023.1 type II secretion system protein GspH [Pseudomonas sp. UME83]UNY88232.1 GspH/FimT family pseudopilin [Pseudomonas sp. M1]